MTARYETEHHVVERNDSAARVYDAASQLVVRRLELLAAEARVVARSGAGVLAGAVAALAGWLYLVAGVINGLSQRYPRFAVQLAVGAVHVAIAIALFVAARRASERLRQP